MLKRITILVEVNGEITADGLRYSVEEDGSISLFPKDNTLSFSECSIMNVGEESDAVLSDDERSSLETITNLYKLPIDIANEDVMIDCEIGDIVCLKDGVEWICEAISCDNGNLLNKMGGDKTIAIFKKLCERLEIPTDWDKLSCPNGGDESDDCEGCAYSVDYHFVNGECVRRNLDEEIKKE